MTAWDNDTSSYISVDQTMMYQEIDGWGGAFNEAGWDAISVLSTADQDAVMESMFGPTGCHFSLARVPIGASDYADNPAYSLDDSPGDYTMANFSIARDQMKLIPFIKAAMVHRPDLKCWGSPWSPPAWMKSSNSLNGGTVNQDSQTLTALALYFAKTVQAYQAQEINYVAVHMANEPDYQGGYPTCGWTGAQEENFFKTYLGPTFKTMNINAQLWLGTLRSSCPGCAPYTDYTTPVLGDSEAAAFITGVGGQYWVDTDIPTFHQKYPNMRLWMTETAVEDVSDNTWSYAESNWELMKSWLEGWANAYMQWNMVLDQTGAGPMSTPQTSMITIDTNAKTVTYNGQFWGVKHYSYYVQPGAHRIATTGNYMQGGGTPDAISFLNPAGDIIVEVHNQTTSDATVAIQIGNQEIKPTLPAQSFDTFRIVLN